MPRASILRSTPLRLAFLFALLFLGAFLITGFAAEQFMKWELLKRRDQAVQQTYAVIANAYGDRDLTDLLDAVRANIRSTRDRQRIFLVADAAGNVLAGNVPAFATPLGWSDVEGRKLGLEKDLSFRVLAGNIGGKTLAVGFSNEEIASFEEIALTSFAWASIIVILLAVAGGGLIALQAGRRFAAVSATMLSVSHGELSARIPLSGRGDDIDLLSREINDALERLEATVEGMRQVSADIAHDLKTPLNRLKMTVETALEKQSRALPVIGELEAASEEADNINRTFEALLRIAQIEAGARRSKFSPIDVISLLENLAEIYGGVAEDAGQSLTAALDPRSARPPVRGDEELLTQMYANLIENAIRHCPPGARIHIASEAGRQGLATSIEDNGPGIPEAERSKVFRRLYRLEKSRNSPGSGLGLSLVRAVAELHGAEVTLEDAAPGLRVRVLFPPPSLLG